MMGKRHSVTHGKAAAHDVERHERGQVSANLPSADAARRAIEELCANEISIEYLKKNVSKHAMSVLMLLDTPKTDEEIAERINIKVNAIRRILNITQGYGITDYYVAKNTGGWLSFAWYINVNKIKRFFDYINSTGTGSVINSACDDYFICGTCYKNNKLIFVFESAFEVAFRCGCGKSMTRISRAEAELLINTGSTDGLQHTAVQQHGI